LSRAVDRFAVGGEDRTSAHADRSAIAHARTAVAARAAHSVAFELKPETQSVDGEAPDFGGEDDHTLSVAQAARLLGRDRTRVYALVRSGDLNAAATEHEGTSGPLRIERSSVERWLVAGGEGGRPLSPRSAWALIGLASGDQPFSDRCLGLLEYPEELSRTRARLARGSLIDLAPRLRRRATRIARELPRGLRRALERDGALARTGISAAGAYGWNELTQYQPAWVLDAYVSVEAFSLLQKQLNRFDIDNDVDEATDERDRVMLRVVNEPWPFPPHYVLAPQPLAALDLLDYPDPDVRRAGREVLNALGETRPIVLARRSARARARTGPLVGGLLELSAGRAPRPRVDGDPKTDTRAAAAHIVGVLWASGSQGVAVKELRAAIGLSRERLEAAYEFLLANPSLGLAVQRLGDTLLLVTAPEVAKSVERYLGRDRPASLSKVALEVLAIIAYRQPIARAGVELIRGSASDSALDSLLQRRLIEHNPHHLLVTTRVFLDLFGFRDLADLPPLASSVDEAMQPGVPERGRMIPCEE
jgi:segregation and condensation protein B